MYTSVNERYRAASRFQEAAANTKRQGITREEEMVT